MLITIGKYRINTDNITHVEVEDGYICIYFTSDRRLEWYIQQAHFEAAHSFFNEGLFSETKEAACRKAEQRLGSYPQ